MSTLVLRSKTRAGQEVPIPSTTAGQLYAQVAASPSRIPRLAATAASGVVESPRVPVPTEVTGAEGRSNVMSNVADANERVRRPRNEDTDDDGFRITRRRVRIHTRETRLLSPRHLNTDLSSPFRMNAGLVEPDDTTPETQDIHLSSNTQAYEALDDKQ